MNTACKVWSIPEPDPRGCLGRTGSWPNSSTRNEACRFLDVENEYVYRVWSCCYDTVIDNYDYIPEGFKCEQGKSILEERFFYSSAGNAGPKARNVNSRLGVSAMQVVISPIAAAMVTVAMCAASMISELLVRKRRQDAKAAMNAAVVYSASKENASSPRAEMQE